MSKIFTLFLLLIAANAFSQVDITTGLVAHYPLDGSASDISGNANNGIIYGATATKDRFGNIGKALIFNGVDNWVELTKFNTGTSFTVSFWISTTDSLKDQIFVARNSANPNDVGQADNAFFVGSYLKGKICTRVKFAYDTIDTLRLGWIHYAVTCKQTTKDSSELISYKNGKFQRRSLLKSVFDVNAVKAWCLGQEWDIAGASETKSDFFKGSMDDVYFFSKALSYSEINNLIEPIPTLVESKIYACEGVDALLKISDNAVIWYSSDLKIKLGTNTYNAGKLSAGTYYYYASQVINGVESVPTKQTLVVSKAPVLSEIKGNAVINYSTTAQHESYSVDALTNAIEYNWSISPSTLGGITFDGNKSIIEWNSSNKVEATVMVDINAACADVVVSNETLLANTVSLKKNKVVTLGAITDVQDSKADFDIEVVSPSAGSISVLSSDVKVFGATIFDEKGSEVGCFSLTANEAIYTNLKPGVYFVSVAGELNGFSSLISRKVVIK